MLTLVGGGLLLCQVEEAGVKVAVSGRLAGRVCSAMHRP